MQIHYFQKETPKLDVYVYPGESIMKKISLWSLHIQLRKYCSDQNMKAFHWNTDYCQVTWNAGSLHCYCWELIAFNNRARTAFLGEKKKRMCETSNLLNHNP